jgi:lipopolysaccharide/colanic/teichoic acid biosynthesis glycosyltransferase
MTFHFYPALVKPVFDKFFALVGLCCSLPLTLPAAILLLWQNKGTCFYIQKRPGKQGKIFSILKFKTMSDQKDAAGQFLPDHARLTPVGKWIRQSSLDEIPQLVNVLIGDMSIVGPRPLLVDYLELYNPQQARRHEVTPGITGWAQVNGRNAISWEDKFKLDVWYVDHQSIWLDLKIIGMTVAKVFKAEGISAQNHATVEKFEGSR